MIDYGMGNLLSVRRGLEHCGANVKITSDPNSILSASRLVLPGVGAFADGMFELCSRGLDDVVRKVVAQEVPLLGICLGMQMLLDESEEFTRTAGLGLIPGKVIPVPPQAMDGHAHKIPHIGWNALTFSSGRDTWSETVLEDVQPNDFVYFVHSFMASPTSPEHSLANCHYGGVPITATIMKENIFGCQFHPEKSGQVGLKVLSRFLKI